MTIQEIINQYTAEKTSLENKIKELCALPYGKLTYETINALDEINEELNTLENSVYDIGGTENIINPELTQYMTPTQMIANLSYKDQYFLTTFNTIKTVANGNYAGFVSNIEMLANELNTCAEMKAKSTAFLETDITTPPVSKLGTPILTIEDNLLKWAPIDNADGYNCVFIDDSNVGTTFVATPQLNVDTMELLLDEITTTGTYIINVVAASTDPEYLDSDTATINYTYEAAPEPLPTPVLTINNDTKSIQIQEVNGAVDYEIKVVGYNEGLTDLILNTSISDGKVIANTSTILIGGQWEIEAVAKGDGITVLDSLVGSGTLTMPETDIVLDNEVEIDNKSFAINASYVKDVDFTESTDKWTIVTDEDLKTVTAVLKEGYGRGVAPITIVANPVATTWTDDHYVGSSFTATGEYYIPFTLPAITNVTQNGVALDFEIALGEDETTPDFTKINIAFDSTNIVYEPSEVVINGTNITITDLEQVLIDSGASPSSSVELTITNISDAQFILDSEPVSFTFNIA